MIIDCGSCAVAGLACDDCVVSVLLGPAPVGSDDSRHLSDNSPLSSAVSTVADEHAAALAVLADAGLVPPLRLVPRSAAS